jgi:hypothetical protein
MQWIKKGVGVGWTVGVFSTGNELKNRRKMNQTKRRQSLIRTVPRFAEKKEVRNAAPIFKKTFIRIKNKSKLTKMSFFAIFFSSKAVI